MFIKELKRTPSLSDVTLEVVGFVLLNVGTSAFTESEVNANIVPFINEYGHERYVMDNIKIGFIHSHHNMATSPSQTDVDQVATLAPRFNYFVSLIVNCAGSYTVLIGYEVTVKTEGVISTTLKDQFGELQTVDTVQSQNVTRVQIERGTVVLDMEVSPTFKQQVLAAWTQRTVANTQFKAGGFGRYNEYDRYDQYYESHKKAHTPAPVVKAVETTHYDSIMATFEDFLNMYSPHKVVRVRSLEDLVESPKTFTIDWDDLYNYYLELNEETPMTFLSFKSHIIAQLEMYSRESSLSTMAKTRLINWIQKVRTLCVPGSVTPNGSKPKALKR